MIAKILVSGGCGYSGSRIVPYLWELGYQVYSCDLGWFGDNHQLGYLKFDYKDLPTPYIQGFDAIVHLAGHSSVPFCEADKQGSFENNVANFISFVRRLKPEQKFIYASSGSVYGNQTLDLPDSQYFKETSELPYPIKDYDWQKQCIDKFIPLSGHKNYFGLRFGTLSGFSPNPRNELMINSMVRSASLTGEVKVTSAYARRAILGLNDLCRAVQAIIEKDGLPGIYNLASFNHSIAAIGSTVAKVMNSQFKILEENTSNYSFGLDTTKFQKEFDFKFEDTILSIAQDACKNDFKVERDWLRIKYG
jgi:nucleoside-diphosphate-sugar epimerase